MTNLEERVKKLERDMRVKNDMINSLIFGLVLVTSSIVLYILVTL